MVFLITLTLLNKAPLFSVGEKVSTALSSMGALEIYRQVWRLYLPHMNEAMQFPLEYLSDFCV